MKNDYFKWGPEYQINVKQMDQEHESLIACMNEIVTLVESKQAFSLILEKLTFLLKLTERHFANEEKYFDSIPYEKSQVHKNIHKELLTRLRGHAQTISVQKSVPESFFLFLKVWLSAHILGIDAGYAKVAQSKIA